jgi:hypothetical protein
MKCNETRKCAMKRENVQERALSASVGIHRASAGKHRAYGALYRNVLHDIPMEVQVIMRTINGLLAWICPLHTHRNMSPYTALAPLCIFQCLICHLKISWCDILSGNLFGVVRGARLGLYQMTGEGEFSRENSLLIYCNITFLDISITLV